MKEMKSKVSMRKKNVTIVCAVHNEQQTIPLFYQRLKGILSTLKSKYNFELIFTNNRSTDSTYEIIQKLMNEDPIVKLLTLSRNFGYQASVQSGITYANGDCIITIDVDCEDPPELIPEFLKKWEEGYDIVYGIRANRPESKVLIAMRNLFYKILKFTADTEIILNMAEFGLIANYVRDVIIENNNTFPFLRTEIAYSGFNNYGIVYNREKRIAGETHYNIWRMALFAIGGILSSSTFPLRLMVYAFPFIALSNVGIYLVGQIFQLDLVNLIICADLFYIIFQLTILAVYIARLYKNGVNRPLYIIDWRLSSLELKKNRKNK